MPRHLLVALPLALAACASLFAPDRGDSGGSAMAAMTEPQVRQLLLDQGYADIAGLHATGDGWSAAATRGGKAVTVDVDRYGIIHIE
jgi:hypothetical protein